MKLTAGQILQNGKYVLDAVLSQGGFGVTYRATHTYLSQTVVIKTVSNNLQSHADFGQFQERFITEARILAKFHHPNIVKVSDFFREDGLPFIVMDYIPGKTLGEIISNQPLTEAQATRYIRQVGTALNIVHQNGLLHRDVKPENIILRQGTQDVVLIDFGIAREVTPGVTETNTGLLSAGYAPVEQYLPQHQWTMATDVYALAATFYALLTGQPPVASVLRDRVPLVDLRQFQPYLSLATEQAIFRGMILDAKYRPQTVEDWLGSLPQKTWEEPKQVPTIGHSLTATLTGVTLPVLPRSEYKSESDTAVLSPQAARSLPPTDQSLGMRTAIERSLFRALIATSVIAAIAGGSFGLILRFGGATQSGFAPVKINLQTFPPKPMPGTTMPMVPSSEPSIEEETVEELPTVGQTSVDASSETALPSDSAASETATDQPESTVLSPTQDFSSSDSPSSSTESDSTSISDDFSEPEPSDFNSIDPASEPTTDSGLPDPQASPSAESTSPVPALEQGF